MEKYSDEGYESYQNGILFKDNPYSGKKGDAWEDGWRNALADTESYDGDYDNDGQPDWNQEWEDFGEVYDDSYPLYDGGEY